MIRPTYIKGDYTGSKFFNNGQRIVCGTSGLGGVWGKLDEKESIEVILYALSKGIRVFDTAPSYGNAQQILGKALKRWKGPIPFVSTKVGRLKADKADEHILDYSPETMKRSVYESLEIIGIDKIDLLFLHEPQCVPLDRIDEILDTLKGFKEDGLVDMIGIGGNPEGGFYDYIKKENFDVLSGWSKLNACNLNALEKDIPIIKKEGIAYYNASVLHLALLGTRLEQYSRERPNSRWISNRDVDIAVMATRIASRNGLSISSLAFRYAFSIQEADRIVLGSRKMHQMQEALNSWNEGPLPEDIFNEVTDNIIKGYSLNN